MGGDIPVVGPWITKALANPVATAAIALGLLTKGAHALTNAHIRMTEEFVNARKTYQVGAAYAMGLQPTTLGRAQAARAVGEAVAGIGGLAIKTKTAHEEAAARFAATPAGVIARKLMDLYTS